MSTSRFSTVLITLCLIVGFVPSAYAQRPATGGAAMQERMAQMMPGKVIGSVQDAATGETMVSVTVSLWTPEDSTLVTGAITDAGGRFEIDRLRPGAYYLRVSYVGYRSETVSDITLTRSEPERDLGTIRLQSDVTMHDGIEVAADREAIQFGIDRTIYNIRDQPIAAGGNATDVLQNVPSVEVDFDGRISLRGNQNVAIMINGRPAPMRGQFLTAFLQQLPANTIERVEVIPNPSARYEPDGMAGILNIVLKQDAELGWSGGLSLGAGSAGRYNFSGNLGYQSGPWNIYSSYGFRADSRDHVGFNYRENRFRQPLTFLDQDTFGERDGLSNMFSTNIDYRLSARDELSASGMLSFRTGETVQTNIYRMFDQSAQPSGRYDRISNGESDGFNANTSLSYKRNFEQAGRELRVDSRFSYSANDDFNRYIQQWMTDAGEPDDESPQRQTNDLDDLNHQVELQVDYTQPIGKLKAEVGYKGSIRHIENDFFSQTFSYSENAYLPDLGRNNAFAFDEYINAGYVMLGGTSGPWRLQAGARLEQANTTFDLTTIGESFDNDYFSIFPSANVAYALSDRQQVKISYSRRIQRPRTRMLNPFASMDDPLHLFVGNPYLAPEYVDAFEMGYQRFNEFGSLNISPFYRRTSGAVRRIRMLDEDGVSTVTFMNLATAASYGIEIVGTVRLGQRLNAFLNFNGNQTTTDGTNVEADMGSSSLTWSARAGGSIQLRPGLDLQGFYMYRAPTNVEQGRISSFSMANVALRQQLWNDRANLTLRVMDPFNTMGFGFRTDTPDLLQIGERRFQSRQVNVSLTINLGQQQRRQRGRQQEDMPDRDLEDVGIQ